MVSSIERFTCELCKEPFARELTTGRKLSVCPTCRETVKGRAFLQQRYKIRCASCGVVFQTSHPETRRCVRCAQRIGGERLVASGYTSPPREPQACAFCGKMFVQRSDGRSDVCSRECWFGRLRKNSREPKAYRWLGSWAVRMSKRVRRCGDCNETFYSKGPAKRCPACRILLARRKARKYRRSPAARQVICEQCGVPFVISGTQGRRIYCEQCGPVVSRAKKRDEARRRRARKRGNGSVERFSSREIFERDGWLCGICGGDTWKEQVAPHPNSPSLDHIVALANGGTHTRDNVQCACFQCNSIKGASE